MRERQHEDTADHSLPTRRERLRAFATLKSQRQVLIAGVAILGAAALMLGGALWQQDRTPDLVKLGKGVASVDAQPVAALDPLATVPSVTTRPDPTPSASESPVGSGDASYYGKELAGNRTASGEIFDPSRLTAAHRTLPLGSEVRVTNPKNGRSVIVKINDRGPYHGNCVIDLSTAAAYAIGLIRSGTGRVSLALLMD
ncbi:septal ring lytic transglycosylase RlpA family protein [Qipengyuania sp. XHP0207]|uniref:septal ring lytic transglycosylase RlpA family protein n=1 Tax=Qipengyuania sp. XHP0207 TaxID=3038078 RepID=UPI00241CC0BA|nr:septal ring lytic transglycosylase RlpA family protein [Qipengyuania sp. XHP0207]MDG5746668.1 septal ring lytic transglycosylase RlpA family protein [Qipengyuania sp. XHP0207]